MCEAVWQRYAEVVEVLLSSGARITHSHKLLHNAIIQRQVWYLTKFFFAWIYFCVVSLTALQRCRTFIFVGERSQALCCDTVTATDRLYIHITVSTYWG